MLRFFISCIIISACFWATSASCNLEKRYYNIPAQPLEQALIAYSLNANKIIITLPEAIKGLQSNALIGHYSSHAALSIILSNTPLTVHTEDNGGYIIKAVTIAPLTLKKLPNQAVNDISEKNTIEETMVIGYPFATKPNSKLKSQITLDSITIEKYNLDTLEKISALTPNFTSSSDGEGVLNLGIRGIKSYAIIDEVTSPVSLHHNANYLSPNETETLLLFDINNIAIQPGANISGLGRTSVAGNIEFTSHKPLLSIPSTQLFYGLGDYAYKKKQALLRFSEVI